MSAVSGVTDTQQAALSNTIAGKALGKEDFLQLLVAQLNNQDPLNPADATEFTAQLAQFSSLEQLFNVNSSLQGLASLSGDMERISALGLIGREVVVSSDQFDLGSQPVELGYRLTDPAAKVSVHILNQDGQTVASLTNAETGAGDHYLGWDGTDNAGKALPAGSYTLAVVALDGDEKTMEATPLVRSTVTGVAMDNGVEVVTDQGHYAMSKVSSTTDQAL